MLRIPLLLLVATLAGLPVPAQAATLFTGSLGLNSSNNLFGPEQSDLFDLDLAFMDDQLSPINLVNLFDGLIISPSNVGETYVATAVSGSMFDPMFLEVVDRLTDATPGFIHVILTEAKVGGISEGRGPPEAFFFANGSPPAAPNPAKATIDSIAITLDKFVLLPNGTPGIDRPFDLSLTLTINGTPIPEPATGWLLACGLATLGQLLFRRRKFLVLV